MKESFALMSRALERTWHLTGMQMCFLGDWLHAWWWEAQGVGQASILLFAWKKTLVRTAVLEVPLPWFQPSPSLHQCSRCTRHAHFHGFQLKASILETGSYCCRSQYFSEFNPYFFYAFQVSDKLASRCNLEGCFRFIKQFVLWSNFSNTFEKLYHFSC